MYQHAILLYLIRSGHERVKWNFESPALVKTFTEKLDLGLKQVKLDVCCRNNCREKNVIFRLMNTISP